MTYLNAWLSLIGWNEIAFVSVVLVLMYAIDKGVRWHDKAMPWKGLLNRE